MFCYACRYVIMFWVLLVSLATTVFGIDLSVSLKYIPGRQIFKRDNKLPRIVRLITRPYRGGIVAQTIVAYEFFLKKGYDITLLVSRGSMIEEYLEKNGLPYYSCELLGLKPRSKQFRDTLYSCLLQACIECKADIIHSHKDYEYSVVRRVAQKLKIASIAHYHSHMVPDAKILRNFDAFIASSQRVARCIQRANVDDRLGIKYISFIYPPCDEDKFLNFVPQWSKGEFFQKNFNIDVGDLPIVCMIANIDPDKNHDLLLDAISLLINKEKILLHVIFAGGDFHGKAPHLLADLKQKTINLSIQNYVHFIGFTSLIPELLFHSDIKVLSSIRESFGIALLEAALMKKPIVLSDCADVAGLLIQQEKTGLIAKGNDPADFAYQIKKLINDPALKARLGQNAYEFVLNNFSNKTSLDYFDAIYQKLFLQQRH